jgi:hypothetical protein
MQKIAVDTMQTQLSYEHTPDAAAAAEAAAACNNKL